jgi:hypothetical protein
LVLPLETLKTIDSFAGKPLIYDTLHNYSDSARMAYAPKSSWSERPQGYPVGSQSGGSLGCTTANGDPGVLDCAGRCFVDSNCVMQQANYTYCSQMYLDKV